MIRRWSLLLFAASASAWVLVSALTWAGDQLAAQAGATLSDCLPGLAHTVPPVAVNETPAIVQSSEPLADESKPQRRLDPPNSGSGPRAPRLLATPGTRGLSLSAARVRELAARGVRPTGGGRGARGGLVLSGVGALGVGLQDGDVLLTVEGQPVSSEGAVVGAVLAARGRRAPVISGLVERAGVRFWLAVEQPYGPIGQSVGATTKLDPQPQNAATVRQHP